AFEKEGFDTETSNGEMLLSMICAVAQEESLSISQNMKWGIHKRMRAGNYITNATPFGYTQINHQLVPEKNNAMIVNDIFKSYLSGMSINEIAEHLNTIYPKENSKWNPRTIHAILRNEKYIGDSLYQKTYTTDSLPLKRYLNTGQRSKYYAMETHEGIISKTDYEKVQNLLAKKSITGEIDRTCVFSKKIYCSICGAICSRKGPPTQGFVWCCRTHLQSKALCLLKSIREDELQQAFLSIYNRLQCNQKTILEPLVDDLLGLRHLQEQKYKKRLALGEDIQHLAKQKHNLTRIHTLGYIEETQFIERSAAIEQQIREKKQQLSRNDMPNTSEKFYKKQDSSRRNFPVHRRWNHLTSLSLKSL
ncbi:MAG: recombinase family protein, partial [Gemmiger formicilis]|uniref:recombinase family protein n=1 Tax=Gemmiger formicilis TaxID=745368 RepID=UPI0039916CCA